MDQRIFGQCRRAIAVAKFMRQAMNQRKLIWLLEMTEMRSPESLRRPTGQTRHRLVALANVGFDRADRHVLVECDADIAVIPPFRVRKVPMVHEFATTLC